MGCKFCIVILSHWLNKAPLLRWSRKCSNGPRGHSFYSVFLSVPLGSPPWWRGGGNTVPHTWWRDTWHLSMTLKWCARIKKREEIDFWDAFALLTLPFLVQSQTPSTLHILLLAHRRLDTEGISHRCGQSIVGRYRCTFHTDKPLCRYTLAGFGPCRHQFACSSCSRLHPSPHHIRNDCTHTCHDHRRVCQRENIIVAAYSSLWKPA